MIYPSWVHDPDQSDSINLTLSPIKALVIGDVMLDGYIYGTCDRISPEAPVPVILETHRKEMLGGAGNVINNLLSLGNDVQAVCRVGKENCFYMAELLPDNSIVEVQEGIPTTKKTRIIANDHQIARIDNEIITPLPRESFQKIHPAIKEKIYHSDIVVLSDYGKGFCSFNIINFVVHTCRKLNKPLIVDPNPKMFTEYNGATVITPNLKEAYSVLNKPISPLMHTIDLRNSLNAFVPDSNILLTCGGNGMYLFYQFEDPIHIPATPQKITDVSGAGDTVVAVLAMCLANGMSLLESAKIANIAGGIVVEKQGTSVVTINEIKNAIQIEQKINRESNTFTR